VTLDLYTQTGEKKGSVQVSDVLFKAPLNEELMRLAVVRQLANSRQAGAHTKTKAEVSGGGKKPWRQKGTGRARAGSIRSPLWRGGGIIFGPRSNRNFTLRMNKKAVRGAMMSALSQKAAEGSVFVLEGYEAKGPQTKTFAKVLQRLPQHRSLLVVLSKKDDVLEKSARNLPAVKTLTAAYLNTYDLLRFDKIMFLADSIKAAEDCFLN